ncbi:helix-turn-helix domain-containing protein [Paenibacillus thalictri]|nr:AraC family transcriptional regulator [Paenibacillus thalictri]
MTQAIHAGKYGVGIRWTSRYDYERGGKLNVHEHDFYQIIYFIDGKGEFYCGGAAYPLAPGTLFFIRPCVRHGFITYGNTKVKTLDLKFEIADSELRAATSEVQAYQTGDLSEMKACLEKIRREGMYKPLFYKELAEAALIQLLYALVRHDSQAGVKERDVQPAPSRYSGQSSHPSASGEALASRDEPLEAVHRLERYIREHYAEELSLEAIAELLSYSKNYLSHSFKAHYGSTFTRYLRNIRIERAKELIVYSGLSLKQISEEVGFKTVHHFSRVFKETEGINPGEWKLREHDGIRKDVLFDR